MGGPQSRSRHGVELKNSQPPPEWTPIVIRSDYGENSNQDHLGFGAV